MNQQWNDIETVISIAALVSCLAFLILSAVPLIGYFAQIGAVFSVLYFAYRSRYWLLALGAIGSLMSAILLFGFSLPLFGTWANVIIPAGIWGLLSASGRKPLTGFIIGGGISVVISLLLFYLGKDLIFQAIDNLSSQWIDYLQGSAKTAGTGTVLIDELTKMFTVMKRLVPSFLALSGVMQLFIGWFFLTIFLKYIGEFFPSMGSFIYWKMPYYYAYLLGLFMVLRLLGDESMRIVADNMILFFGFFYAAFGFALFEYYLKKIKISMFMRILFYIGFLFLQLPGLVFAAIAGLFDSYFDFRKVRAKIIG